MDLKRNEKIFLAALILLLLAFKIHLNWANPTPVGPDVFERLRISQMILESKAYPSFDASIAPHGAVYAYPPLIDFVLVSFSTLTSMPMELMVRILPIIFFALYLLLAAFILFKHLDFKAAALALIIVSLNPFILERFTLFIAETLGLVLMLAAFYFYEKRNDSVLGLILAVMALTHLRSFLTLALILIVVFIFRQLKRQKTFNPVKVVLPVLVFALPWFLLNPVLLSLTSFQLPTDYTLQLWFYRLGYASYFLILALAFLFLYWRKVQLHFKVWFLLPFALSALMFSKQLTQTFFPFPYRQLLYAIFPMGLIAGKFFMQPSKIFKALILLIVLIQVHFIVFSWPQAMPAYSPEHYSLMDCLKENVKESAVVLADYKTGYLLQYNGFKVVAGSFMERLPDASQRLADLNHFFEGREGQTILDKYQADCFIIENEFQQKIKKDAFNLFYQQYSNEALTLYCRKAALKGN